MSQHLEGRESVPKIEIERKYLVRYLPYEIIRGLESYDYFDIEQGYDPQGVRIRRSTSKSGDIVLTSTDKKTVLNTGGVVKEEPEVDLSEEGFNRLWLTTADARLSKRRYIIPFEGLEIHLDFFKGDMSDFRLIEVEFPTYEASLDFATRKPEWFGREVTTEVSNHKLARKVIPVPQP